MTKWLILHGVLGLLWAAVPAHFFGLLGGITGGLIAVAYGFYREATMDHQAPFDFHDGLSHMKEVIPWGIGAAIGILIGVSVSW